MKVLVVCARRYNGHELWTALMVFQRNGIDFEVVSQDTHIMDEVTGEPNILERTVYGVPKEEMVEFDGIMVVSGNMKDTESYWDDKHVLGLIDKSSSLGHVVGAICCSVPTIRRAASNKRVSFYPLLRSRERLLDHGALLSTVAVSTDGNLCTAEHQMASEMWAENFVDRLNGNEPRWLLKDSGYVPKGRPRKPIPELEDLKRRQAGVTGPDKCPDCGYATGIDKEGRVMCPKCDKDLTHG
jgi:putative intracellular protease/amidase